ncbi:MAG: type II secretion system major pseudopilin GspG [Rhodospirillaceae bacterium]|nr:type II secretion system major pseudopilin GspG [Rhodospirillaceae bacterium]MBT6138744.1 type II secretion system major pseudopilin GspG [Rhodospirillaceae bacterium]
MRQKTKNEIPRLTRGSTRKDAGFTLLEVLVVLAILALVAGLVAPRVMGIFGRAQGDVAHMQIQNITTATDMFRLDVGRFPSTKEGLEALVNRPAGLKRWNGPYLKGGEVPADPWGNAYSYEAPSEGKALRVISLGADGKTGGSGDDEDVSGP